MPVTHHCVINVPHFSRNRVLVVQVQVLTDFLNYSFFSYTPTFDHNAYGEKNLTFSIDKEV